MAKKCIPCIKRFKDGKLDEARFRAMEYAKLRKLDKVYIFEAPTKFGLSATEPERYIEIAYF